MRKLKAFFTSLVAIALAISVILPVNAAYAASSLSGVENSDGTWTITANVDLPSDIYSRVTFSLDVAGIVEVTSVVAYDSGNAIISSPDVIFVGDSVANTNDDGTVRSVTATIRVTASGQFTLTATGSRLGLYDRLAQATFTPAPDTVPPVIALSGLATVNLTVGDSWVDPGATATDDVDGSVAVVVSGDTVNTAVAGTYYVRYNASDAAGNAATEVVRTVIVSPVIPPADTTPPVIVLNGAATIYIEAGPTAIWTDPGATATDNIDDTVTVVVSGDTVNTAILGTYVVKYDAVDAAGNNATQVVRTVIVRDTTSPVITLNGLATVNLLVGDSWTDPGATATDSFDSTVAVTTSGNTVNTATAGTYHIRYNAVDASGNTAAEVVRAVIVNPVAPPLDANPPVITLNGSSTVNLTVGDSWTDPGATAVDNVDGPVSVVITGTVDLTTPGTYVLTYSATDAAGNAAVEVVRTVVVGAATPPPPPSFTTSWSSDQSKYVKGSGTTLVFTVTRDLDAHNGRVLVGGVLLTNGQHYTITSGSTVVTLNSVFLESLSDGTHTITVEYIDGRHASGTFSVAPMALVDQTPDNVNVPATEAKNLPQTGDVVTGRLIGLMALFSSAGIALFLVARSSRKKTA
jgi:hypothetical protein